MLLSSVMYLFLNSAIQNNMKPKATQLLFISIIRDFFHHNEVNAISIKPSQRMYHQKTGICSNFYSNEVNALIKL